jgi:Fe-S oxidoreductase
VAHSHCYQKALGSGGASAEVLNSLPGCEAREIDSGCCGMAGSFGYESEHYAFSQKVGETRLFPALRAAAPGQAVVAAGFSCRAQIASGTGKEARPLVEVLAGLMGTRSV